MTWKGTERLEIMEHKWNPAQVEACYNKVAHVYGVKFRDELEHKPLDRDLLSRFADRNRQKGLLCDLGCGVGHVGAVLQRAGCRVMGIDLSAGMVAEAARLFPEITFRQDDMLVLSCADETFAGIAAFYSIVHFPKEVLPRAFSEMHRVLQEGGELLLAFHNGNHTVHAERFLDQEASADFYFFEPDEVAELLKECGFEPIDIIIRYPYPEVEFASKRTYIYSVKRSQTQS